EGLRTARRVPGGPEPVTAGDHGVDLAAGKGRDDLGPRVAHQVDDGGRGDATGRVPVTVGPVHRVVGHRELLEAVVTSRRAMAVAVRPVQDHERVTLGAVGDVPLDVGHAENIVCAVAVHV